MAALRQRWPPPASPGNLGDVTLGGDDAGGVDGPAGVGAGGAAEGRERPVSSAGSEERGCAGIPRAGEGGLLDHVGEVPGPAGAEGGA